MKKLLTLVLVLGSSMGLMGQAQLTFPSATELEQSLSFEGPPNGTAPGGWSQYPAASVFVDDKIVHGGKYSARIERMAGSDFSTVKMALPINFGGKSLELRGFLRTENVSGFAGLWIREDGDTPNLVFNNMQERQINGTTPWREYSITVPLHPEAKALYLGVLVFGTGRAWADDLRLTVDGQPIWNAPKRAVAKTILDTDTEFADGSKIAVHQLTQIQIDNLVTLGKVWGFLKYHHPTINSGKRQWDFDLFRVLPRVLEAKDRDAANARILEWVRALGAVPPCSPCATLPADLYFAPDVRWLSDEHALGPDLSLELLNVYKNRSSGSQFYVSLFPHVLNPQFDHELLYPNLKIPDFGMQLLAVYRFWNAVEYWSPYRDIAEENWNSVLAEGISKVALAKNTDDYRRALMVLIGRLHDGHANLWDSLYARPPLGKCQLPVTVRFVENRPVVSSLGDEASGIWKVGDVITELGGTPIAKLISEWLPYYTGSNDAARRRDVARFLPRGDCGEVAVGILRSGKPLQLAAKRIAMKAPLAADSTHDRPGPTFRLLSKDVAYLKLSNVRSADAKKYVEQAAGTKGLIIDIRNYPSEFMVFDLGSLLVSKETPFARFTNADLANPGTIVWGESVKLTPAEPHYSGKVVIVVDEVSMSQAEYTAMAFRSAQGSVVVGSTTSGADGNISGLALPGGVHTMMSGIGVFYPDNKPTQRIGIVPDVRAEPTISGVAAGRDEVLEKAIRQILGETTPLSDIQNMIH